MCDYGREYFGSKVSGLSVRQEIGRVKVCFLSGKIAGGLAFLFGSFKRVVRRFKGREVEG